MGAFTTCLLIIWWCEPDRKNCVQEAAIHYACYQALSFLYSKIINCMAMLQSQLFITPFLDKVTEWITFLGQALIREAAIDQSSVIAEWPYYELISPLH